MGRTLKRVPLDFEWPQGQVWKGYLNPFHSQECKSCGRSGYNEATKKISDAWYSFDKSEWVYPNGHQGRRYNNLAWHNHLTDLEVQALVKAGRLMDFTHTWSQETGWVKKKPAYMPTAEEVNEWNKTGMGHDAINQSVCVEARAKHLGVWGKCKLCKGDGEIWQSSKIKKLYNAWKSVEPPKGKGFQLWETTTEGSPASPVFDTLDKLCEWCEDNASTFGSAKTTKENWKNMLDAGHVYHKEGNGIFI